MRLCSECSPANSAEVEIQERGGADQSHQKAQEPRYIIEVSTPEKGEYEVQIVISFDANRKNASDQIGFIEGLVIDDFEKDSPFHALCWKLQKPKRPVRSIGSAETIDTGLTIDKRKLLTASFLTLLNVETKLHVCVESKVLWDSLRTCYELTDKSVKADVNVIRYEF